VGTPVTVAGRSTTIAGRKGTADRVIIRLDLEGGRTLAEELRGADLEVSDDLRPALDEDEFLAEDLVGCAVHAGDRSLGVVVQLLGLPSCEALVVDGTDVVVPLVRDAIEMIDVDARRIDVNGGFLGLAD
jgi:16S rRNA processing protein RimM